MSNHLISRGCHRSRLHAAVVALAAAAACNAGGGEDLQWQPCAPRIEGGRPGDCATSRLPLRAYDQRVAAEGPLIDVVVKRVEPSVPVRGDLWLLDGGPGGTGAGLESPRIVGPLLDAGWRIYIPTHRGAGASTPLTCPTAQAAASAEGVIITDAELPSCVDELTRSWGEDLGQFSAFAAAEDLGRLIEATRADVPVAVWGGSYGSYWAQRYLQRYPEQADAVILDGVLDVAADVWNRQLYADDIGHEVLDLCAADPVCNDALSGDPVGTAAAAIAGLDHGRCPALVELGASAQFARDFLMRLVDLHRSTLVLVPAVIHRLTRCSDADVQALVHLAAVLDELSRAGDGNLEVVNQVLQLHIATRDLWREGIDLDPIRAELAGALFGGTSELELFATLEQAWPRFGRRADADAPAESRTPVLVLSGGIDILTPPIWAERVAAALPNAQHVHMPTAGHVTLTSSPLGDGRQCGSEVLLEFLAEPSRPVTASCATALEPIDMAGTSAVIAEVSAYLLGDPSPWGTP